MKVEISIVSFQYYGWEESRNATLSRMMILKNRCRTSTKLLCTRQILLETEV